VDPYDEVYELMEEHQSMLEADARIEGVDVQRKSPFEFWNQIPEVQTVLKLHRLLLWHILGALQINELPKEDLGLRQYGKDVRQLFVENLRLLAYELLHFLVLNVLHESRDPYPKEEEVTISQLELELVLHDEGLVHFELQEFQVSFQRRGWNEERLVASYLLEHEGRHAVSGWLVS